MNACIRAVVRGALYNGLDVVGIERGYNGLVEGDIFPMTRSSVADSIQRGGTILKTARSKAFQTEEGFTMALNMIRNFKIDGLIIIGGNGSLAGALELSRRGVKVIGLPGTIDNDLGFTDYSIGYDTAVNTALAAISNIRDTSHSHDRTTIVEVMGRDCGDIAIYSGLGGGAEAVLIPEQSFDIDEVCRRLIEGKHRGKMSSILIKSEGVEISSQELSEKIREKTGLDAKVVILGYIQRGGSPTARDRVIASRLGYEAVKLLMEDRGGVAVGIRGEAISVIDLEEALQMKSDPLLDFNDLASILAY
jgi:6-phosphofructokinase 1